MHGFLDAIEDAFHAAASIEPYSLLNGHHSSHKSPIGSESHAYHSPKKSFDIYASIQSRFLYFAGLFVPIIGLLVGIYAKFVQRGTLRSKAEYTVETMEIITGTSYGLSWDLMDTFSSSIFILYLSSSIGCFYVFSIISICCRSWQSRKSFARFYPIRVWDNVFAFPENSSRSLLELTKSPSVSAPAMHEENHRFSDDNSRRKYGVSRTKNNASVVLFM